MPGTDFPISILDDILSFWGIHALFFYFLFNILSLKCPFFFHFLFDAVPAFDEGQLVFVHAFPAPPIRLSF